MDSGTKMVRLCIRGIKARVENVQKGKLHRSASVANVQTSEDFYCIQFLKYVEKECPFNHYETATMSVSLERQAKALLY